MRTFWPDNPLPQFAFIRFFGDPAPSQCEQYETVTLLTPKIRFLMLIQCPMTFTPSHLESGEGAK